MWQNTMWAIFFVFNYEITTQNVPNALQGNNTQERSVILIE